MGSIAAQDLTNIVGLTESVAAVHLLACAQAVDVRGVANVSKPVAVLHAAIRAVAPMVHEDRRMDGDIAAVLDLLRADGLPLDGLN